MYGMVNEALRAFLVAEFGEEGWEQVRKLAGVKLTHFLPMSSYDDAITYELVGAASESQNVESADLLRRFGRTWVQFARDNGFKELMDFTGGDLFGFLANLDVMHAGLEASFRGYSAPSFRLDAGAGEGHYELHYYSRREGLAPFVVGLLQGAAELFGIPVRVEEIEGGDDHPVFSIVVQPSEQLA
jgi:hypothetical protein